MKSKVAYRVKNWNQYNQSLVNRGNVTLWLDQDAVDSWNSDNRVGKRGRGDLLPTLNQRLSWHPLFDFCFH
jgi:hypothetical protein